jgi:peptidoglycan/xylan/chitin deacetylase (PgdA/CDA1 family)
MNLTLTTIAFGCLLGALLRIKIAAPLLQFIVGITKGIIAGLLAKVLIGTELNIIIVGLATLIGHNLSLSHSYQQHNMIYMTPAIGILLILAPWALITLVLLRLIFTIINKDKLGDLFIILVLPLVLWCFRPFDIYLIFSIFCISLFFYRHLDNQVQNSTNTPEQIELANQRKTIYRKAIMLFLISFLSLSLFFTRYVYRGFGMQIDLIRNGNRELKFVSLTFDDGPDPVYTPLILDILADYDLKASFFLIGKHAEMYLEIASRIAAEGHDLGNHTYTHRSLVPLSIDKTKAEILQAHNVIESITGTTPYLFRPPRGIYSNYARELLQEEQYTIVLWSLSTQDWAEIGVRDMVNNTLRHIKGGDIILFHDGGNLVSSSGGNRINTVKALPRIIEGLHAQGYTIVPVSELLLVSGLTTTEPLE